jgi:hypothetical protein
MGFRWGFHSYHLSKNGCRKSGFLADPDLTDTVLYTNQRRGVHGPLNISEMGSGAMEEQASPVDRSHPL